MAAAMAMMQQQQLMLMQQQQMRLASTAMPNMPGLAAAIAPPNSKKQREIYVGNLPSGLNEAVLKELFIQILQGCEDFNTASGPIVLNVQLCGGGQYAFIEFRDEESILAASSDPEACYRDEVLPRKLDLAEAYVQDRSLGGDLAIIMRTMAAIVGLGTGTRASDRGE